MALTFGNATTHVVNYGSGASLDNLDPMTVVMWVKRAATHSVSNTWWNKRNERPAVFSTTGSREPQIRWQAATTDLNVESSQPHDADVWGFWVFQIDTGDSQHGRIFYGTQSSSVNETGYNGTPTNSSGALDDNAANDFRLGNNEPETASYGGDIGLLAIFNRVLTLGEKRLLQFRPTPFSGCVLFSVPGLTGTGTQPDWSGNGNSGTVTGATQANPFPMRPFFAWNPALVFAAAAPPAGLEPVMIGGGMQGTLG